MINEKQKYDLTERTAQFSENVINLCSGIKESSITRPIISQLIRSATSVGANYMEANNASSRKDFRNKIFICKKEAQETKYWLRLVMVSCKDSLSFANILLKEAQELIFIFQKITSTLDKSVSKIEN